MKNFTFAQTLMILSGDFSEVPEFSRDLDFSILSNDFSASVKCWPLFHEMKMNIMSHSDGVINCSEGSETIVVETPAHIRYKLYRFIPYKTIFPEI